MEGAIISIIPSSHWRHVYTLLFSYICHFRKMYAQFEEGQLESYLSGVWKSGFQNYFSLRTNCTKEVLCGNPIIKQVKKKIYSENGGGSYLQYSN